MKKINNKGMTLMELIVSVALISIIMLFMYKLISDVRGEKRENDKVTDNIIKISEIEVAIENAIAKEEVKNITINNTLLDIKNNSTNLVQFVYEENGKFKLTDKSGKITKWTLENVEVSKFCYLQEGKLINIKIYLKSGNKEIHVIEIPYYSDTINSISGNKCT